MGLDPQFYPAQDRLIDRAQFKRLLGHHLEDIFLEFALGFIAILRCGLILQNRLSCLSSDNPLVCGRVPPPFSIGIQSVGKCISAVVDVAVEHSFDVHLLGSSIVEGE